MNKTWHRVKNGNGENIYNNQRRKNTVHWADSNKKKQVIFTSESYNQHQAADMLEGKLFCNQCKVALVLQKDARQGI